MVRSHCIRKMKQLLFSKAELISILKITGFEYNDFYYPFPDYKLPRVILKEGERLYEDSIPTLIYNLLYTTRSINYSGDRNPSVHEGRVLKNFIDNKCLDIVSNSFLVVSNKIQTENRNDPLVFYYSNNRRFEYANEIKFWSDEKGTVFKKNWYGYPTKNKLFNLSDTVTKEEVLVHGTLLSIVLDNYFLLKDRDGYQLYFNKWLDFLKNNIKQYEKESFDLIPRNIICSKELVPIDIGEWVTSIPLSISQLVYRHVKEYRRHFIWLLETKDLSTEDLVTSVLDHFGIEAINEDEKVYLETLERYKLNEVQRKKYSLGLRKHNRYSGFKNAIKSLLPNFLFRKIIKIKNKLHLLSISF